MFHVRSKGVSESVGDKALGYLNGFIVFLNTNKEYFDGYLEVLGKLDVSNVDKVYRQIKTISLNFWKEDREYDIIWANLDYLKSEGEHVVNEVLDNLVSVFSGQSRFWGALVDRFEKERKSLKLHLGKGDDSDAIYESARVIRSYCANFSKGQNAYNVFMEYFNLMKDLVD